METIKFEMFNRRFIVKKGEVRPVIRYTDERGKRAQTEIGQPCFMGVEGYALHKIEKI